jgi:hypothetical protein
LTQPAELAATRVVDQEIDADLPCACDDSLATLIGAEVNGQTGDGLARSGQPGAHLLEQRLVAADQQQARRGGQSLANAAPMPLVAPVTSAICYDGARIRNIGPAGVRMSVSASRAYDAGALYASHQHQNQKDDKDQADDAAWSVAPISAVRPSGDHAE